MFLIALAATILAFVQNLVVFSLGMKELAILSFPLSFAGIFLAEVALIWTGYFCVGRFFNSRRMLLTCWAIVILGAAEPMLPASYIRTTLQHARRKHVLEQIHQTGTSIEALVSDKGNVRFALTYTLQFPKSGHYLTFPAYLGRQGNRVFGNYFTKLHPEYFDENYVFDGGEPYSFTVLFDTEGEQFDFARAKANIDICDGKDYFMACRVIAIGLEEVPEAFRANPKPERREPTVPADNVRDVAERSIRLDALELKSETTKAGLPVEFSYVITNVGNKDVAIPGGNFENAIGVNYAWEAVSEAAKKTKVTPGMVRFGDAVAAGTAQFTSVRKEDLVPSDRVTIDDKIAPFEPLAPGDYRLHVYLFSRYATEINKPEQELVREFSVAP
jgi:hypothetical protein